MPRRESEPKYERINFTLPVAEAKRYHDFARAITPPGEKPNLSLVIRQAMREKMARWERSQKG